MLSAVGFARVLWSVHLPWSLVLVSSRPFIRLFSSGERVLLESANFLLVARVRLVTQEFCDRDCRNFDSEVSTVEISTVELEVSGIEPGRVES